MSDPKQAESDRGRPIPSDPDDVWVDAVADALEPPKRGKGATMFDPQIWKSEHRIALVVCMIAGALLGLMVGFVLDRGFGWTFGTWLARNSGEAVLWTVTGALTVGAAVYTWRSFSK